jgi:hypothetical protein
LKALADLGVQQGEEEEVKGEEYQRDENDEGEDQFQHLLDEIFQVRDFEDLE